ncbi:hypothetical protein EJ03DRAFT_335779 [Teratosphaeria nubilosa]|uniref:Luciferase domain-containing protein n=1 Tax=Teratosphaeria nubilosa TaxID=161662 RepID=A0A6G1LDB0_9PEZI|nr:hypothetical protein EJ03DRAFT_335779 [Teratosphaeria nubilosa]
MTITATNTSGKTVVQAVTSILEEFFSPVGAAAGAMLGPVHEDQPLALTWSMFVLGYLIKTTSLLVLVPFLTVGLTTFVVGSATSPLAVTATLLTIYLVYASIRAYQATKADYTAFLALGPGGTPSTPNGFKRISLLAMFGRIDLLTPPSHDTGSGFLSSPLPRRAGVRPTVGGIAPQRQLDQRTTEDRPEVIEYLLQCFRGFAVANGGHILYQTSFLEKCTEALISTCDSVRAPLSRVFGCEVSHPHHVDGSLHVMLHSADIAKVIAAGYRERHPLARANPAWTAWFFITESRPPVPENLVFVYAPRTVDEVDTVMEIVKAGAAFVADGGPVTNTCSGCANHHPRV